MNPCAGRRGFLTLSSCGEPAGRNCADCSRPTCPEHLSPASGFTKCLECANGKGPARKTAPKAAAQTPAQTPAQTAPLASRPVINDADDAYLYRQSYYADRSYTPMSDWDRSDSRAFAHGAAAGALAGDDDEGHPGFGDS